MKSGAVRAATDEDAGEPELGGVRARDGHVEGREAAVVDDGADRCAAGSGRVEVQRRLRLPVVLLTVHDPRPHLPPRRRHVDDGRRERDVVAERLVAVLLDVERDVLRLEARPLTERPRPDEVTGFDGDPRRSVPWRSDFQSWAASARWTASVRALLLPSIDTRTSRAAASVGSSFRRARCRPRARGPSRRGDRPSWPSRRADARDGARPWTPSIVRVTPSCRCAGDVAPLEELGEDRRRGSPPRGRGRG